MQKASTKRGPLSAKDIESARMPCYVGCEYLNTGVPHRETTDYNLPVLLC